MGTVESIRTYHMLTTSIADMLTTAEGALLKIDDDLIAATAKVEKASDRIIFRWLSLEALGHTLLATLLAGAVNIATAGTDFNQSATITLLPHAVTGVVLGLMLTTRILLGSSRAFEAGALLPKFCQSCRTMAVLATHVSETLTIPAGAAMEKAATAGFRYELVRHLNLAWYLFKAMLMDVKVNEAPLALRAQKSSEAQVHRSVKNPTIVVVKMISKLLDKQLAADRISASNVALFNSELAKLIETYHAAQSMQLSPPSVALEGFTKFFTVVWVYTVCPIVSLTELSHGSKSTSAGFVMALCYSFVLGLFFFGLFEAGKLVVKPVKAIMAVTDLEEMTATLSDDLANLVDDPDGEVPVFLPGSPR